MFNDTFRARDNDGDHGLSNGPFTMSGLQGNDVYFADHADTIVEAAGQGTDEVRTIDTGVVLSANVENLTLLGTANINGTGNGGAYIITGNSGDNVLTGAGGADTLEGNGGIDTAHYVQAITPAMITPTGGGWIVATGGAEGTDTLSHVERITDSGTHAILLVGNGGFATIQDAVNYATAGDTIVVAAGTWVGATIDKELTLIGQGSSTTITSGAGLNGFSLTGDIDDGGSATVTIKGFEFTGNQTGVSVASNIDLDHLVIQNASFLLNTINGVGMGSGAFGLGAIDIVDSSFVRNGNGTENGDGDISLFGFTGDALIKNVTIAGGTNPVANNTNADFAIQLNGREPVNYDVTQPIGNVVFDHVTVNGSFAKVLVYIQGYTDLNGLHFNDTGAGGTTLTGAAGWGFSLNLDPMADESPSAPAGVPGEPGHFGPAADETVNLANVHVPNNLPILFRGTPVVDNVTGSGNVDIFIGREGDDSFNGALGTDTAGFHADLGTGHAAFTLSGGQWHVNAGVAEGTDSLSGTEVVKDGDGLLHTFRLVGAGSQYATTQQAFAAGPGDIIIDGSADFDNNQALIVDGTSNNSIDATEATSVSYTVNGLDVDATGVVTFTDGNLHQVTSGPISANGTFTIDLHTLDDGPITSVLHVTDSAGLHGRHRRQHRHARCAQRSAGRCRHHQGPPRGQFLCVDGGRFRLHGSEYRRHPVGGEDHHDPGRRHAHHNSVAVNAGDFVSAGDITAGHLVFTPDANGNGIGYASFTFQVQDTNGSLLDRRRTPSRSTSRR